ncbi:MAG: endolytic transglycosylase MltG [Acidobacteria bacterium]|nr:endolytic transglycosylase MltG [Acidobacteriota bacterium]MBI3279650.1 endolytic transglycosylase MltG [Acidobacteriota bacterium]
MRRLVIAAVVLATLGSGALLFFLASPYQGFREEVFIDIPPGTSARAMASVLEHEGVIRSRWSFLAARALNPRAKLQAGEYRFHRPASTTEVFRRIARGDIFYHQLVVPEGATQFEVAASLEQMGLMKAADFFQVSSRPELIRDIAPQAPSLEGYLFPAVYRLTRRTSALQLCRDMTQRFRRAWTEMNAPPGTNLHEVTTLASLVEKETAIAEERPLVAAVFVNRLRIGMKLDCDPTAIYAALLEGRYRGTIYRSDLENPHRYNTYMHAGLPPGPIANPGLQSLRAALNPAATKYLYFVAKGDGSGLHVFSETIDEHRTAVNAYRWGVNHPAR